MPAAQAALRAAVTVETSPVSTTIATQSSIDSPFPHNGSTSFVCLTPSARVESVLLLLLLPRLIYNTVMFCAGYKLGGDDSCAGDSGGPFFVQTGDDQFAQVGIVSWGRGCGRRRQYGVYTRLSYFSEFIQDNLPPPRHEERPHPLSPPPPL